MAPSPESNDRQRFLAERRRVGPERMDALFAPNYDEHWGTIDLVYRDWLARLLGMTAPGARVLDAGCGTGKYWPQVMAAGRRVIGVDRSAGMLREARRKHPEVEARQMALEALSDAADFAGPFDGVICIDAMENVFPEDWPRVLAGFAAILEPGAPAYITVELPEAEHRQAIADPQPPLVTGELLWPDEDGSGYHFYPSVNQVSAWLGEAGFVMLDSVESDLMRHVLVRR